MKIKNSITVHTIEVSDSQLDILLALFAKTPYFVYEDKYNFCLGAGYSINKATEWEYSALLSNIKELIKNR